MKHTIEKDWISDNGHRCVVIMTSMGHRCGYVGIDKNNLLFNTGYSEKIDITDKQKNKLLAGPLGKRNPISLLCFDGENHSPSLYFNVHGGITYANGVSDYPVESDLWWFGFDCAHVDDAKDLTVVDASIREIEERYPTGGIIRSLEYCFKECENLSEQIKEFEII